MMTAIREATQIRTLPPTQLVAFEAHLLPVFNATDTHALVGYDMIPAALAAADWRLQISD